MLEYNKNTLTGIAETARAEVVESTDADISKIADAVKNVMKKIEKTQEIIQTLAQQNNNYASTITKLQKRIKKLESKKTTIV
jgi:peptidoglycan hydrolase CwlO-like protein